VLEAGGNFGSLMGLVNITGFLIVVGGTFGTTFTSFPMKDVLGLPKLIGLAFKQNELDIVSLIPQLVSLADKARREGLLALEADVAAATDEFFKKGVQMVADGIDLNTVKDMLETELSFIAARHAAAYGILESMGGYSPTMGIIGTVMGLIGVLGNMGSDVTKLGASIAVAFVATLYGVGFANLIWLPLGTKLKRKSEEEILMREVIMAGVLAIQSGDNPQIVEEKLKGYLPPALRRELSKNRESLS
jgi:chemotaxis protein MotA